MKSELFGNPGSTRIILGFGFFLKPFVEAVHHITLLPIGMPVQPFLAEDRTELFKQVASRASPDSGVCPAR